jgi:hypothetical protein
MNDTPNDQHLPVNVGIISTNDVQKNARSTATSPVDGKEKKTKAKVEEALDPSVRDILPMMLIQKAHKSPSECFFGRTTSQVGLFRLFFVILILFSCSFRRNTLIIVASLYPGCRIKEYLCILTNSTLH